MVLRLFVIEGNLPFGAHCWSIRGENSGQEELERGMSLVFYRAAINLSLGNYMGCCPSHGSSRRSGVLFWSLRATHIKIKIKKNLKKLKK